MPKKTSDLPPLDKLAVMLVGEPGHGKTVAAASFPGPVLILDIDRRVRPVQLMYPERTDIYYEQFNFQDGWIKFENFANTLENRSDYRTIVLDSLTSLARMAVNYHLAERNPKSIGTTKIKTPDWPEWKFEDRAVFAVLSHLRNNCGADFFIVNAHLQEYERTVINKETQQEEQRKYRRIVTGMKFLAAELPAYFDEVYFIERDSTRVRCFTRPQGDTLAKTALPLPKMMDITAPNTLFSEISKALKVEVKK